MEKQIIISSAEQRLLLDCISGAGIKLSSFNKEKLQSELENAQIVDESLLPKDAIRLNSYIEFRDLSKGKTFTAKLVPPQEADMATRKISYMAPISIAFLGYRKGAIVDWEMPGGIKTYHITEVSNA